MEESNPVLQDSEKKAPLNYAAVKHLTDNKQHADKIIQGIKKLEEKDARRAIWELFQNAIDLSRHSDIRICYNDSFLSFSHNGAPFTFLTLDCLIKQVSAKTFFPREEKGSPREQIGEYGTGFMTTHSFGKRVVLDSWLDHENGKFSRIAGFLLDRSSSDWKEVSKSIAELVEEIDSFETRNNPVEPPSSFSTTFTYHFETDSQRERAELAVESLDELLPMVFAIHPRLKSVAIKNGENPILHYQKVSAIESDGVNIAEIKIGEGKIRKIYSISSDDQRITIILPFKDSEIIAYKLGERVPRLFLFYPMIGTHLFGINFIIHSPFFKPTEPRDGIYLHSGNEENLKEEEINRELLSTGINLISEFLEKRSTHIQGGQYLASVHFPVDSENEALNSYFRELRTNWENRFLHLKIVETSKGMLAISEAQFLKPELVDLGESLLNIYDLIDGLFDRLPTKDSIIEWCEVVGDWEPIEPNLIGFEKIVEAISKAKNLGNINNHEELLVFYKILSHCDRIDLFEKHSILPNINGEFIPKTGAKRQSNLSSDLIEIGQIIIPDVMGKIVDPQFEIDGMEFEGFGRKSIGQEIIKAVEDNHAKWDLKSPSECAPFVQFVRFCSIQTSVESNNVPTTTVRILARLFGLKIEPIILPNLQEDVIDLRTAQKNILKICADEISSWNPDMVRDNFALLKELFQQIANYKEYDDLIKIKAIFPNKFYSLKSINELMVDCQIPMEILEMHQEVVMLKEPAIDFLVHPELAGLLPYLDKQTPQALGNEIEQEIISFRSEGEMAFSIRNHPNLPSILKIIEWSKNEDVKSEYFPRIVDKRIAFLAELAEGPAVFDILTSGEEQLKILAQAAKLGNLREVIEAGKQRLSEVERGAASMAHKKAIGVHIENLIREHLGNSVSSLVKVVLVDELVAEQDSDLSFEEVQNGQDIIVYLNSTPIYYIEVKSRWDSNSSIRMSKNQTINAAANPNCYALCSVDMTKYEGVADRYEVREIEKIMDLIKFNTDIGTKVEGFAQTMETLNATADFRLEGDLRTVVPLSYIAGGDGLGGFVEFLVGFVREQVGKTGDVLNSPRREP